MGGSNPFKAIGSIFSRPKDQAGNDVSGLDYAKTAKDVKAASAALNAPPPGPPDLSDEVVRNAITSERARLLAGNSRKAAFLVGSATDTARKSTLGT